jgi:hypothetical protein
MGTKAFGGNAQGAEERAAGTRCPGGNGQLVAEGGVGVLSGPLVLPPGSSSPPAVRAGFRRRMLPRPLDSASCRPRRRPATGRSRDRGPVPTTLLRFGLGLLYIRVTPTLERVCKKRSGRDRERISCQSKLTCPVARANARSLSHIPNRLRRPSRVLDHSRTRAPSPRLQMPGSLSSGVITCSRERRDRKGAGNGRGRAPESSS